MAWIKKYWFKIVNYLLICFILVFVPTVCFSKVKTNLMYEEEKISTKIYKIWNVETFEGGKKSRKSYLIDIAKQLEKKFKGVLFLIDDVQPENLENLLSLGSPDLISFGYGVGKTVLPYLENFNNDFNLEDRFLESGSFNNKLYAIPYIVSGYALFTHGSITQNFHCGQNNFINPQTIYNSLNYTPAETETQYEAYKDFVYDKTATLLGTARDMFKIDNLSNLGRLNANISPIDSFSDLVQYFGIVNLDKITSEFLNVLISSAQQRKLVDYGLFSPTLNNLYSSGIYKDMEVALQHAVIPNVFD